MRRLFTFGCSFTQYNWPSWADLLGKEDEFIFSSNWGCAGLGNRAIAERVAECSVRADFTPDDIVIVQWSSHFRHDWMHTGKPIEDVSFWRTKGSIFSPPNHETFDQKWVNTFWDEKAYYIHTLNSITLTQALLNSTGCTWYMTSLNDLSKVGNFIDQRTMYGDFHHPDKQLVSVWDIEHSTLDYKIKLWDKHQDQWMMPMTSFRDLHPESSWYFKVDPKAKDAGMHDLVDGKFREAHLSMDQHVLFLQEIKKLLGFPVALNTDQQAIVDQVNDLKNKTSTYDDFLEEIKKTEWGSTLLHKGY